MDVLSEILDKVELTSSYWYRTSFAGDWGIHLPQDENLAIFHIVTHGEFWYEVPKLNRLLKYRPPSPISWHVCC